MITKLDVTSAQGGFLSLSLQNAFTSFPVQEIDGIYPVKATLVSTVFAQQNGARFQSSKREPRDIRLTLGLEPNWAGGETVAQLRRQLYDTLIPESAVLLEFTQSDGPEVEIAGVVESCEAPIFTKDPTATVVIRCFDPDFIDPIVAVLEEETVADTTMTSFVYPGTVETGYVFKLMVNRTISDFTIYHTTADGIPRQMLVSADLLSGDVVTISTVSGDKFATLTRAAADSSILYAVAPQADWSQLTRGINQFRVQLSGAPIPYTLEYLRKYGGL
jgi:hypothetical protein